MGSSRKSHIGENNMSNYTVNTEITKSLCEELYDDSALTLEGLDLDSLDDYAKYLDEECGLKENAVFHVIDGYTMNSLYDLSDNNAYPDDLHIIVIKLSDLVKPNNIVMKRFNFGGRWFDDVVDNNARRECC